MEGGPAGTSDDSASSEGVKEVENSDASILDGTASLSEFSNEDSEHTCSDSGESSIPSDETTTDGEYSEYSSSSDDEGSSESDTSSGGQVNPKVCSRTVNMEAVIVYVMLLDWCK